jgi:hypothetical protein
LRTRASWLPKAARPLAGIASRVPSNWTKERV